MAKRNVATSLVAIIIVGILTFSGLNISMEKAESAEPAIILKAAVQDEMKTKNILGSNDVWTSHVLWQSFEGVLQADPNTLNPVPYILVGFEQGHNTQIDAEDRVLPPDSVGFLPMPEHDYIHPELLPPQTEADAGKHEIVAYYDLNGVLFHDGEQATIDDIIFSYYLLALHPNWYTGIAPLMDAGGLGGNFSTDRWLGIWDVSNVYAMETPVDDPLKSALSLHLSTNYAQLWIDTMSVPIFPQHVWEGKGKVRLPDDTFRTDIHEDFGYAIDSNGIGVPVDHPTLKEYDLMTAMDWEPQDDEVVGTGMFMFEEWVTGSHAKIVRNENYLEMDIGDISIRKPNINAVEFIKYGTTQQATMALRKGEADIILWSVPPDFLTELQSDPNVALTSAPEPGFFYLAFNMRTSVFGYPNNDPSQGDTGKPLREAIAHLIDKKTIVDYYLQGYGIMADGPISPRNTLWYNSSLPKYDFSTAAAQSILDANNYIDNDGDGWRDIDPNSPGDQDTEIELLAPTADYDPIRAQACLLIESAMKVKLKDDTGAGINLKCNPQSFGTIISKIDARDFQTYILGWAIGGVDPDYLYSFFYSMNAERGQNYPGYNSQEFDDVILDSRTETNTTKRQQLIREAQGILVNDLPYSVLYYRDNIEAYRMDRFTGWTTSARGSIFNYWSLMNIKPPSEKFLRTTITIASAVSSNQTTPVTVTVRDQNRDVVKDATVHITVVDGNLSYGGTNYGKDWEGTTNINGQVLAGFEAPYVAPDMENGTKASIKTRATKEGYDDSGEKSVYITVFPTGVPFLSVTIDLPYGDLIDEEGSAEMEITVKDENLQAVDGAVLNLSATPTDLNIDPISGTTANGGKMEGIVLTAPKVDADAVYIIKASPSKGNIRAVNGTVELAVLDIPPPPVTPGFDILVVIAAISIAAISYGVFATRRKRR